MSLGLFVRGWGMLLATVAAVSAQVAQPGLLSTEFIAPAPQTAMSHASTILESNGELLVAWAGGSSNRAPDVSILLSRNASNSWSAPVEIANGIRDDLRERWACWNPVLFRRKNGPLYLFYKEGRSPETWRGMVQFSMDNGRTWSKSKRLPHEYYGPIRNKPIELDDGYLLCPSSVENSGWLVHVERTKDPMREWHKSGPLNTSLEFGAIQPAFLRFEGGLLEMLCRTKQGKITAVWSNDNGKNWSRMRPTGLPNPNSALDAVTLRDGRGLLVYNHSETDRGMLNVAISKDGKIWEAALVLENQPGAEHSYPSVIQASDGKVHVTWSVNRQKIRHAALDPQQFQLRPIIDGQWPK